MDTKLTEEQRIEAIRALSLPGHESLIEKLVADETVLPGDAAKEIIKEKKARLSQTNKGGVVTIDRPDAIAEFSQFEYNQAMKAGELTTAEKDDLKYTWDNSQATRDEFREYDNFVAWHKNNKSGK